MTKLEFKDAVKVIEDERTAKLHRLYRQYAKENAVAKIGDIITDHCSTIIVERTSMSKWGALPTTTYVGKRLTKKLVPFKSGELDSVCQDNIRTINGEQYNG